MRAVQSSVETDHLTKQSKSMIDIMVDVYITLQPKKSESKINVWTHNKTMSGFCCLCRCRQYCHRGQGSEYAKQPSIDQLQGQFIDEQSITPLSLVFFSFTICNCSYLRDDEYCTGLFWLRLRHFQPRGQPQIRESPFPLEGLHANDLSLTA